jgi:starch synthase
MAASEARPLAATGGLADVLRALPDALARLGWKVRRFLPAYGSLRRDGFAQDPLEFAIPLDRGEAQVRFASREEPGGVVTTLVECGELFARPGIYGPPGAVYPDNARRFAGFSRAVVERARFARNPPGILHVHDWHAATVPLFVRFVGRWPKRPGTVLTIHNLGYQGHFPREALEHLALPEEVERGIFHPEGIEFFGGVNYLKAGILYADRITTVSPNYAKEILTPELGWGLEGVLAKRGSDLSGILNGADYDLWDPARDPNLPRAYSPEEPGGKRAAAQRLRERMGLPASARPILGVVSRLVHQKGIDLVAHAAADLLGTGADFAVLGSGDPEVEAELRRIQLARPDRVGLVLGYDEGLSHLVVAGSDLLLMPSRYEPCGLTQMYALRYGTIPVVTRTGGLADTVADEQANPGGGTGFFLDSATPEGLVAAVRFALDLRAKKPARWQALQQRAMAEEFSWDRAALRYAELYRDIQSAAG